MATFDAYGAGFEYTQPGFVEKHHHLESYMQHPKWKEIKPGMYTDDTQMAIALAELMLSDINPSHWTHMDIAEAFVRTFARDPRAGYSGGFYQILKEISKGFPTTHDRGIAFLTTVRPHSDKNGGAMRAGVLGLLPDPGMVVDRAMFQAAATHSTWIGMTAAAASALMVHYFYYRYGDKKGLPRFLDSQLPGVRWTQAWHGRVKSKGTHAVRAALTAIVKSSSLIEVLRRCVDFGGDVDTVAAIAGIAASVSDEITQIMPTGLHQGLENGNFGRGFLEELDSKLLAKYPRPDQDLSDELLEEEAAPDELEVFMASLDGLG
jgi:ADP-ribosylglycohydrolase